MMKLIIDIVSLELDPIESKNVVNELSMVRS
jgi:hypothetical protein